MPPPRDHPALPCGGRNRPRARFVPRWFKSSKWTERLWNAKERFRVCRRLPDKSLVADFSHLRQHSRGVDQVGRLVSLAAQGVRGKIRTVRLDENSIVRNRRRDGPQIVGFLERDHPRETDI